MDKYNSKLALWFKPKDFNGAWTVTLGQTTYYSCSEDQIEPGWRVHEDCHKKQWARDGVVKFSLKYIWQWIWRDYHSIDYEVEARMAARDFLAKADGKGA
jgi:hypothetical protein